MSRYDGMAAWTLMGGTLTRYEDEKHRAIRFMAPMLGRPVFGLDEELRVAPIGPTYCLVAHELRWPLGLGLGWEHVVVYAESRDEVAEHFGWVFMACRLLEWALS